MPWVRTARLGKQKGPAYPGQRQPLRVVIEIVEVADAPPGAGHATRHDAKRHSKRSCDARPTWADDAEVSS